MKKILGVLAPVVTLFFAAAIGVGAATLIGADITTDGDVTTSAVITSLLTLTPETDNVSCTEGDVAYSDNDGQLCFCADDDAWYHVASTTESCQFVGDDV